MNRGGKRLHGLTQCNESAAEDRRIEPVNDLTGKRADAALKGSRSHHDGKVRHDPPRRNESAAEGRRAEAVKDPSGKLKDAASGGPAGSPAAKAEQAANEAPFSSLLET